MDLDPVEVRVLGCLIEKQRTTPDAYPLSVNALRAACNQTTSRDPVVSYDEDTVRDALHRLGRRRWTRLASGAGSRAAKYRHLLADALPMDDAEQALVCVLLLRGPQTPGELRARTERMQHFADAAALQATVDRLAEREFAVRLPRRPGQKEERYQHLLSSDLDDEVAAPPAPAHEAQTPASAGEDRLARLERRLEELAAEVAELRAAQAARGGM